MDTETSIDRMAGTASCGSSLGTGWILASGLQGVHIFEGCDESGPGVEALFGIAEAERPSRDPAHRYMTDLRLILSMMKTRHYDKVVGLLEHLVGGGKPR